MRAPCSVASRVPLQQMPSIRSQLRAKGLLSDFLKEHHPDAFHRRYFQCFPPSAPSLRVDRFSEKLYNFMDVRAAAVAPAVPPGGRQRAPMCLCSAPPGSVLRRHPSGDTGTELLRCL